MEHDTDLDELEFPRSRLRAHAEVLNMAAEMIEEDDLPTALDIIDEVRHQLMDILLEWRAKEEGSGVFLALDGNRPRMALMRPDWDNELDNYFKHE
jgi:hypothetical protein